LFDGALAARFGATESGEQGVRKQEALARDRVMAARPVAARPVAPAAVRPESVPFGGKASRCPLHAALAAAFAAAWLLALRSGTDS
jgi:hypothetical protein